MRLNHYLPLPASILDKTPAPRALWSRRRTVQTTFLLVVAFSVFLLFEYATRLSVSGGQDEDTQDAQDDAELSVDPSLDTVYLPFRPPGHVDVPRKLKPTLPLPASCIDAHFARGELCYHPNEPKLDVLWTWVNGTDVLLQDAKTRIAEGMSEDPYRPGTSWKQLRQFRQVVIIVIRDESRGGFFLCLCLWNCVDAL